VPHELNSEVLRQLAKLGAQARLEQIETERRAILATFPGLAGARRGPGRLARTQTQKAQTPAAARPGRRRRTMTAAQRKEVSERMRRYWAERRKAKGR